MAELITSVQNPKIKHLLALQEKSRLRREEGLFVVEGRREVERCLAAGFVPETIFLCPALFSPDGARCGGLSSTSSPDGARCGGLSSTSSPDEARCGGLSSTSSPDGARCGGTESEGVRPPGSPHHPSGTVPPLSNRGCYVPPALYPRTGSTPEAKVFEVSREVYDRVAYRGGTEGIIAEVRSRDLTLAGLSTRSAIAPNTTDSTVLAGAPLYIVLESVEKPGNLGAVLRSADAAGADGVIICDPLTDIWNPNLIRASLGAVFTVPIAISTTEDAIRWLQERDCRILTAQLQDSTLYYDQDMTGATVIVIGTESTGLSAAWREAATAHIRIPMLGVMDSLNASVSAAILLFEARRQRDLK